MPQKIYIALNVMGIDIIDTAAQADQPSKLFKYAQKQKNKNIGAQNVSKYILCILPFICYLLSFPYNESVE